MSIVTKERQEPVIQQIPPRIKRQPLTIFGKIALWASLLRAFAGLSGIIVLTISKGAPSQDIVSITVFSLVITIIMATRFRWAPLVSALPAGYLLYLTFTQPFALEDLANPKGADGFVLFITAVLAFACSTLVFGGTIGEAVLNYNHGDRHAPRWLSPILSLILGMVIGAVFIGAISQPPVAAPTGVTYTNGVPTVHMNAGSFLLPSVTISKGSSLLLVDDTNSQHDLFNGTWQNGSPLIKQESGAPLVNNVGLKGNSVTIGPFATAGTYHIFCVIHRGMELTIIVQ
jgi:plastocyanin